MLLAEMAETAASSGMVVTAFVLCTLAIPANEYRRRIPARPTSSRLWVGMCAKSLHDACQVQLEGKRREQAGAKERGSGRQPAALPGGKTFAPGTFASRRPVREESLLYGAHRNASCRSRIAAKWDSSEHQGRRPEWRSPGE